ncbi:MAG TPA: TolC family protein [Longimicrobiales bacterium]|nr:TolC family protein [Longimicrobiales bacterium]
MADPAGLRAQAQDSIPLTFEEAVRVALENNPAYLRQVNAIETAEQTERQTFGQAFLPSLTASVDFGGGGSRNQNALDNFGQPIGGTEFVVSRSSSASQVLSGSLALFSLENIRSYHAARARTAAADAGADYQAAVLRTDVGRAYFDAVRRRDLVDVERRGLETARENLSAIRSLLRIAAKDPTDVLGAELALARAEQSLNQAVGEARKAGLALKGAMGVALDREHALATGFAEVFDPAVLDLAALLARAMGGSPRLAQQAASVEAAERSVSAARAARLPSIGGSYSYSRSTDAEGFDAIGAFDLPNQRWRFGFGVDVPLFNRMGTSAAIERAEIEGANARESLREAELTLERELRVALIDLENAYQGVRLAERSAEIARERLAQGRERYRLGTIDYTALQDMLNSVAQEERGVSNALFTFTTALLTVEEKVGGPVTEPE